MGLDLNMDVGDIKNLFSKLGTRRSASAEPLAAGELQKRPYKKMMKLLGVTALGFAVVMGGIYYPYSTSLSAKKAELAETKEKQEQARYMDAEAAAVKHDIAASKEFYAELLQKFGEHEDIGTLFGAVSTLAMNNSMAVINITEGGKTLKKEKKYETTIRQQEIVVLLEGRYADYMAFKEALYNENTPLSLHSEKITLGSDKAAPGKISVTLTLLTSTIDKEPFEKLLTNIKEIRDSVGDDV